MPTQRILYYCYDSDQPSGGEKHSYQHVDVLNAHGFDAFAVHHTPDFRLSWFENSTRVASWGQIGHDPRRDIVVVPENLGLRILDIPGRKVIFNKNVYYGFNAVGLSPLGAEVYLSANVIAVLTVSSHNRDLLSFAYPHKVVISVIPNIRPELFTRMPLATKRPQVAYAAKGGLEGKTLYQLLRGRASLGLSRASLLDWIPVSGLLECEVVSLLQDSLLFIFLSVHEGLPRLPLEAMASGCLVCAYDSGPAIAYLPAQYRFPYGDLVAMARRIEAISEAFPAALTDFDGVAKDGRAIAERYSEREQASSVVGAWKTILHQRPT